MKQLLFLAFFFIITTFHSTAQTKQDEHLLDGTSLDLYYETGSHVHVESNDGQIISQGRYRSKKIGDKMYVVNFLKTPEHSFVTLIFNFNQNTSCASAIRGVGTKDEAIFLEGATIEHLHLKEK
jgi:hypothetical protein